MSETFCKEKQNLVEKLGVLVECKEQFAPMAARILSYIILRGKRGTTFEDLVSHLCASKSTVSTHLNHLADLKRIVYFTKPGDRKKYYTINEDGIIQNMDNMLDSWVKQKELHVEIKDYKIKMNEQINAGQPPFDLDYHEDYIQFLDEVVTAVTKLKTKIINKKNAKP